MTTEKLTRKLTRRSLLFQEYDFTVEHRKGVDNTNADYLSRYPLPSDAGAPLMDWSKGEIMQPASWLAFMVGVAPVAEEERDIWQDAAVLRFLQTHKYESGRSAKERDRIYRRAKAYRWMADSFFKLLPGGAMVVVPKQQSERASSSVPIGGWGILGYSGCWTACRGTTGGG